MSTCYLAEVKDCAHRRKTFVEVGQRWLCLDCSATRCPGSELWLRVETAPQLSPRFIIGRSCTNGFTTFADGDLFEHSGRLYKLCSSGYGWTLRPLILGTNRANYGEHLDGWLDLPSAMAVIVKLNQAAADAEPLPELPWHEASALRCKQCKTPYVKHSTCGCQYCPACWLFCPRCGGKRRPKEGDICPDCGVRPLDKDGWCSKCGYPDNGPKEPRP